MKHAGVIKRQSGLFYFFQPTMRQTVSNFAPQQRELVFDIDMTDYDDIRRCCKGADICPKCWILMTAAVKVIDAALRGTLKRVLGYFKDGCGVL